MICLRTLNKHYKQHCKHVNHGPDEYRISGHDHHHPPCLLSLFALIISFNSIILTILYIKKVTLYLKLWCIRLLDF